MIFHSQHISIIFKIFEIVIDYPALTIDSISIDKYKEDYNVFECTYSQDDTQFFRSYLGQFSCQNDGVNAKNNALFKIDIQVPYYRSSISLDMIYMQAPKNQKIEVKIDEISQEPILFGQQSKLIANCNKANNRFIQELDQKSLIQNERFLQINSNQEKSFSSDDLIIQQYFSGQYTFNGYTKSKIVSLQEQCQDQSYFRISTLQISINTCHPTCLECNGPSELNCTKCYEQSPQGGKCLCSDPKKVLYKGQCADSCDQSQYWFQFNNICIFSKYCTIWDTQKGVCLKCEKNKPTFQGQCIEDCPISYTKANISTRPYCQFNNEDIQGEFLFQGLITNDFSILEIQNLGFQWSGFTFQNQSNGGIVSKCNTFQLFGGFFLNVFKSEIQISFTNNKKYSKFKLVFKYIAIDIPDQAEDFPIASISVNDGKKVVQIMYQKSSDQNSPNICGMNQIDKMGEFSDNFDIDTKSDSTLIKITNLSPQSYFGIREVFAYAFNCESPMCVKCFNQNMCTQCVEGYYTFKDKNDMGCKKCSSNCLTCKDNPNFCISCPLNMTLEKNTCKCQQNYQLDPTTQRCFKCSDQQRCSICSPENDNSCSKCQNNYYLLDQKCVDDCGVNYFKNVQNKTCDQCPSNCIKCSDQNRCSECSQGYFLNPSNQCTKTCPDETYYPDASKKRCVKCKDPQCSSCQLGDDKCQKCNNPFNLMVTICQSTCDQGFGPDENRVCKKCSEIYSGCSKCNAGQCIECNSSQYFLEGQSGKSPCVDYCPSNYYSNPSKVCKKCENQNCETCSQSNPKICTKCNSKLPLIQNGDCVQSCDVSYYQQNSSTCQLCSALFQGCFKCTQQSCQSCSDKNQFLIQDQNKCSATCNIDKYYPTVIDNQNLCLKCTNTTCLKCDSNSPQTCTACPSNLLLQAGNCVVTCSEGFVKSLTNECQKCSDVFPNSNCAKCTATQCTGCQDGQYLLSEKQTCYPQCPEGYYQNSKSSLLVCSQCPEKCLKCDSSTCFQCQEKVFKYQNKCSDQCPEGFIPDDQYNCQSCSNKFPNCSKCTTNNCTQCIDKFYLNVLTQNCVDKCPDGMIENSDKGYLECLQGCTVKNCAKCDQNQVCLQCDNKSSNPLLQSQKCVNACSVGYYQGQSGSQNAYNCLKCSDTFSNCESCDSQSCIQCSSSYPIYNQNTKSCLTQCPPGYYENQKTCKKCLSQNCQTCDSQNSNICLSCIENSSFPFLSNGKCVDICPSGYGPQNGVCQQCSKIYQECQDCNASGCISCKNNQKYLHKSLGCFSQCEEGFYNDSTGSIRECKKCQTNSDCIICQASNPTRCQVCKLPFYNQIGVCQEKCDEGYLVNKTLYKCMERCDVVYPGCLACNTIDFCTKCIDSNNYIQSDKNSCKPTCDLGSVGTKDQEGTNVCLQCQDPNCNKCDPENQFKCLECSSRFQLIQISEKSAKCVKDCPTTHYKEQYKNVCTVCNSKFKMCDQCDQNQCQKCLFDNQILLSDQSACVLTCPPGQFANSVQINGNKRLICKACDNKECFTCDPINPQNCLSCNNSSKYLSQAKCVDKCPDDQYIDEETKSCLKTCTGDKIPNLKSKKCEICKDIVFNGTCVNECPKGYLAQNQSCISCDKAISDNCIECQMDSQGVQTCNKCSQNKFLFNNTCADSCPKGFIANNQTMICEQIKECIKGTYFDNDTNQCLQCKLNCQECSNSQSCKNCSQGFVLVQDSQECVYGCPKATYQQDQVCLNCPSNCLSCTQKDQCEKCQKQFFLQEGLCVEFCTNQFVKLDDRCVESCPKEYSLDKDLNQCMKCPINCLECNQKLECQKCKDNYLLQQNLCVEQCSYGYEENKQDKKCEQVIKCPQGSFLDQDSKQCKTCSLNCLECLNGSQCVTCQDKFYLVKSNSQCSESCPEKTYVQNQYCINCPQNCSNCKDSDFCNTCSNSFFKYKGKCFDECEKPLKQINNECIEVCPIGYSYDIDSNLCYQCPNNCVDCNKNLDCLKCKSDFLLQSKVCVTECQDGYKENKQLQICEQIIDCPKGTFLNEKTKSCSKCNPVCEECKDESQCITCKQGLFLIKSTMQCSSNCPENTYNDGNSCLNCPEYCSACKNQDICNKCQSGYFEFKGKCQEKCEKPLLQFNNQCFESCPEGYSKDSDSYSCIKCQENCIECNKNLECFKCKTDFLLQQKACVTECSKGFKENKSNHECEQITNCPQGNYLEQATKTCQKCSPNCLDCFDSYDACTSCKNGFILIKDSQQCVDKCPKNMYQSGQLCLKCPENCRNCDSSGNCQICDDGHYQYQGRCLDQCKVPLIFKGQDCVEKCPEGFQHNKQKNECAQCKQNCLDCDQNSQCTRCKSDYLIQEGLCVSNCEKGYFKQDKYCLKCNSNCLSCDTSEEFCQECNQNYTLDKQRKKCILCIENCQNCSEDLVCQQCKENYISKNGVCVKACNEGHFYKDSQCFKCSQDCKSCEKQEDNCTDCLEGFKLNQATNKCIKCPSNCTICEENQQCTKCEKEFKLQQNACIKVCGQGFYEDTNQKCLECDKNCKTCENSASNCTECSVNQVLKANQCVICPDGTYAAKNQCQECPQDCSKCEIDQNNKIKCLEKCDKDQGFYNVDKQCKYCYGIQGAQYSKKLKQCVEECGKGFLIKPNILKQYQISSDIQCDLGNSESNNGCTKQCMIQEGYECKKYFEDQFILKQKCKKKKDGPSPQLNLVEIQKADDGYQIMCQVQFDRHVKVSNFSEWKIQIQNKLGQDLQFNYKISPMYNQTDQLLKHKFNIFIKMEQSFQNSTLTLHFPNEESVKDGNEQSLIKLQANLDLQINENQIDDYLEDEMKKNKKQQNTVSISLGSILLSCTLLMIFITKFYDFVSIFDILQVINYFIYLNVNIPNLAYQTMRIFDFANFEIIPNKQKSESSAPVQFQIENYDTFFFSNMIQVAAIWGFSIFIYLISKLVVKYVRIQFLQFIFRPYERKFKYFIIVGVAFLTSHDIILASLLQLYETNLNDIQIFGAFCSIVSLLFISGLIILSSQSHHLTRYPSIEMKDQCSQKHSFFLQNLKPHKSIYNTFLIVRKIIFIISLIYFRSPIQQCMIIHFIFGLELIVLIQFQPFTLKTDNNIQVICKGLLIFSITIITFIAYQSQVSLEINENLNTILGIALSVIFTIIFLIQFLSVVIKAIIKFRSNTFSQKFINKI
ncbi:hypothetical protein ABPG74_010309 [Tetrahymena malaccensis]